MVSTALVPTGHVKPLCSRGPHMAEPILDDILKAMIVLSVSNHQLLFLIVSAGDDKVVPQVITINLHKFVCRFVLLVPDRHLNTIE